MHASVTVLLVASTGSIPPAPPPAARRTLPPPPPPVRRLSISEALAAVTIVGQLPNRSRACQGLYERSELMENGRYTYAHADNELKLWHSESGHWQVGPAADVGMSRGLLSAADEAMVPEDIRATWLAAGPGGQLEDAPELTCVSEAPMQSLAGGVSSVYLAGSTPHGGSIDVFGRYDRQDRMLNGRFVYAKTGTNFTLHHALTGWWLAGNALYNDDNANSGTFGVEDDALFPEDIASTWQEADPDSDHEYGWRAAGQLRCVVDEPRSRPGLPPPQPPPPLPAQPPPRQPRQQPSLPPSTLHHAADFVVINGTVTNRSYSTLGSYVRLNSMSNGRYTYTNNVKDFELKLWHAESGHWQVGPAADVGMSRGLLSAADEAMVPEDIRATWLAIGPNGRLEDAPELTCVVGDDNVVAQVAIEIIQKGLDHRVCICGSETKCDGLFHYKVVEPPAETCEKHDYSEWDYVVTVGNRIVHEHESGKQLLWYSASNEHWICGDLADEGTDRGILAVPHAALLPEDVTETWLKSSPTSEWLVTPSIRCTATGQKAHAQASACPSGCSTRHVAPPPRPHQPPPSTPPLQPPPQKPPSSSLPQPPPLRRPPPSLPALSASVYLAGRQSAVARLLPMALGTYEPVETSMISTLPSLHDSDAPSAVYKRRQSLPSRFLGIDFLLAKESPTRWVLFADHTKKAWHSVLLSPSEEYIMYIMYTDGALTQLVTSSWSIARFGAEDSKWEAAGNVSLLSPAQVTVFVRTFDYLQDSLRTATFVYGIFIFVIISCSLVLFVTVHLTRSRHAAMFVAVTILAAPGLCGLLISELESEKESEQFYALVSFFFFFCFWGLLLKTFVTTGYEAMLLSAFLFASPVAFVFLLRSTLPIDDYYVHIALAAEKERSASDDIADATFLLLTCLRVFCMRTHSERPPVAVLDEEDELALPAGATSLSTFAHDHHPSSSGSFLTGVESAGVLTAAEQLHAAKMARHDAAAASAARRDAAKAEGARREAVAAVRREEARRHAAEAAMEAARQDAAAAAEAARQEVARRQAAEAAAEAALQDAAAVRQQVELANAEMAAHAQAEEVARHAEVEERRSIEEADLALARRLHAEESASATWATQASADAVAHLEQSRVREQATTDAPAAGPDPPVVPEELLCPITCELMEDPVSTVDGHTYERSAIQKWLRTHATSPVTNERLESKALIPNVLIRGMVRKVKESSTNAAVGSSSTPPAPSSRGGKGRGGRGGRGLGQGRSS